MILIQQLLLLVLTHISIHTTSLTNLTRNSIFNGFVLVWFFICIVTTTTIIDNYDRTAAADLIVSMRL